MNTKDKRLEKSAGAPFLPRLCALVLITAGCLLLAGCETFRMWGEKSSSTPGTVGGSMSIPLGKK